MRTVRHTLALLGALLCCAASAPAQALPFFTNTAQTVGFESNAFRTFSRWVQRTPPSDGGDRVEVFAQVLAVPVRLGPETVLTVAAPAMRRELRTEGAGPALANSGFGDLTVSLKQRVYVDNFQGGGIQFALLGGVKLPTGDHDRFRRGELLPAALQLGTGSVDFPVGIVFTAFRNRVGFNAEAGYRFHRSAGGVSLGDETSLDLALGYRLLPPVYGSMRDRVINAYLELNLVWAQRTERNGGPILSSGGTIAYLSPGLQWVLHRRLLVEGAVQVPVVQDLNGTQPEFEPTLNLGLRMLF